jgi:hypothetical protein
MASNEEPETSLCAWSQRRRYKSVQEIEEFVSPASCYQCIPRTAVTINKASRIPPPATCKRKILFFSELGRITLVATGWATVHTSRSTCGGRHPGAGDAVGRHHPHGHGLQARGPGGEASKGTEQRGEEGYAEDMGEMPRVAGPTPSSTPMT